jgi:predicted dehydrogenase
MWARAKRTIPLSLAISWSSKYQVDFNEFGGKETSLKSMLKKASAKGTSVLKKKYGHRWNEVIGKRGRIICDLFKNTMDIRYGSRSVKTTFKQMKSGWIREIEHFVECIHNNLQPQVTGEDGKKALEMVLAAYTSQETRNPVNLPP